MERIDQLKARLDALRPLSSEQLGALWPRFDAEKPVFVQTTNAIEGNRLTLGETSVVLQTGMTVGGKTIKEHLEVINSGKAFDLMLSMAQDRKAITRNTLLALHEAIVAGAPYAGSFRDVPVFISGAPVHVPPEPEEVRPLMEKVFATYESDLATRHPIVAGAKLHYNLLTVHPFEDGNGRTARLVHNLHLVKHGFPPIIIDAVNDKPKYFDVLVEAQSSGEPGKGDPAPFIEYMTSLEERALLHYVDTLQREGKINTPAFRRDGVNPQS
jgi:Fic family protein